MQRVRHRLNCGSTAPFTGPDGSIWEADVVADGRSRWGRVGGASALRPDILPIHPPAWAGLLRSEAHGMSAYRFDLPPGSYAVRLIVAETHPTLTSLARRFALSVAGQEVVPAITPAAIAGGFARPGEVRINGIRVAGDGLSLGFSEGANLAGIEIAAAAPGEAPAVATAAWVPERIADPPDLPAARRVRMLFAGHSGTFYWAIPETVARLVALHLPAWRPETSAFYAGGKGVRFFLESPELGARLAQGGHAVAVVQDSSWGPLEQPDDFAACMPALIQRVRDGGALPVLYAYSGPLRHAPAQRRRIQELYDALGAACGAPVVPCALALALAQEAEPGLDLHDRDQHHLGIAGGFLVACCWYRALCGFAAPALREHSVLAGRAVLPPELARCLAAIADRACAGRGPAILDLLGRR